jgi:hypothetical protein
MGVSTNLFPKEKTKKKNNRTKTKQNLKTLSAQNEQIYAVNGKFMP